MHTHIWVILRRLLSWLPVWTSQAYSNLHPNSLLAWHGIDLRSYSCFCNSCKPSLEGQSCGEAARIPLHPRKNTMRRQTLGVPITTRQHIHHHKCWQAVIGIPSACADRPSTKVHKTYRHTSASSYVGSYSHLPPAILKYISRRTQEEHEAKGSGKKHKNNIPKLCKKTE
jgi:hypothetical protein